MRKALFLYGSKQKKNSYQIGKYFKELIYEEYDINEVFVHDLDIKACTGCDYCSENDSCIFNDDMGEIYRLLDQSELIVLITPIYFHSVSGALKNLIDRTQMSYYVFRKSKKKPMCRTGILLASAGSPLRENRFTGAKLVADYFFRSQFAEFIGVLGVADSDRIKVLERKEDIIGALSRIRDSITNKSYIEIEI